MDERAQSIGIARLFLGLAVGAAVLWVVNAITDPLFERAKAEGTGQVASNGTTWLQEGVGFMPILFLMVSFFGVIAYAVWSREVAR